MPLPTVSLSDLINQFLTSVNTIAEAVGDLADLQTDTDSNLVAAINSLSSGISDLFFSDIATFEASTLVYGDLPSGTAGGDTIYVGGAPWITLPLASTHLYLESAGGVKARRSGPVKIIGITGQSNAAGTDPGGPNPASSLVATWDGQTAALGSSDFTQNPWARSAPHGNSGNNNYALGRAHYWASQGYASVIVFDAVGGTSIDQWVSSGKLSTRYAAFKTKVEAVLSLLGRSTIDEIIWAQGEEDFNETYTSHIAELGTLRDQFRSETWFDNIKPIYFMGPSNLHRRYQWFEAFKDFSSYVDNRCIFVPSAGLTTEYESDGTGETPGVGDWTHFLGASLYNQGYYGIADARPAETPSALFYSRGAGPLRGDGPTALATFTNLVSRGSWTDSASPQGPSATGSISWGTDVNADGNWTFGFGHTIITNNLANYSLAAGRDLTIDSLGDYGGLFGYQSELSAPYGFAAGRGHDIQDSYSAAFGSFSKYVTPQSAKVMFQIGAGATSESRFNVLTARASGAVEIQTADSAYAPAQNGEYLFRKVSGNNKKVQLVFKGTDGVARRQTFNLLNADSADSSESLIIYNSAGTVVKTINGA